MLSLNNILYRQKREICLAFLHEMYEGSIKRFMKKLSSFCLLETIIFMLRKSPVKSEINEPLAGLDRNLEAK